MAEEEIRVRLPREGEIYGIVTTMLGASRMNVDCEDGETRLCRVRGKMRKRVWVRINDYVLVKPWSVDPKRGDIVWRYTKTQSDWLKRRGYLKM